MATTTLLLPLLEQKWLILLLSLAKMMQHIFSWNPSKILNLHGGVRHPPGPPDPPSPPGLPETRWRQKTISVRGFSPT